ncbi:MAG: hypothetical protein IT452_10130 [Planctomycetia bacterium]|nr:hypothetical protein [Planctomycetia bacterium]
MEGERRRILGEGAWVVLGQVAVVAGGLLGTRLLTQFVPPSAFGDVALLLGAAVLVRNMAVMPLAHAGTRFYPELAVAGGTGMLRRALSRGLRWAWAAAALALAAGACWSLARGGSPWAVPLVSALFVIDAIRTLEITYLSAARRQAAVSAWNSSEAWLRPAVAVAAATIAGASAVPVLAGYAAASGALLAVFVLTGTRAGTDGGVARGWTEDRLRSEIRAYAAPMVPLAVVLWATSVGDRFVIGWLRTPTEVGIYAAAYGLVVSPFMMAQGVVTQTLRPVYLESLAASSAARGARIYAAWFGLTAAVCAAGFGAVCLLSHVLAAAFLAPQYRTSAALMPWLAGGAAIQATAQVVALHLLAHKRSRTWALSETAGAVLSAPILIVLVGRDGAMGAARAFPAYAAVTLMIQAVLVASAPRRKAPSALSPPSL